MTGDRPLIGMFSTSWSRDHLPQGRSGRYDHRCGGADRHRVADRAHIQADVDDWLFSGAEAQSLAYGTLESIGRGADFVLARRQERYRISAGIFGNRRGFDARSRLGGNHRRFRYRRALRIGDHAAKGSAVFLAQQNPA